MQTQNISETDVDSTNIGLATLGLGSSREASINNDPFKAVIRRHHRARDITDEFCQAAKGKLLRASTKAMQMNLEMVTAPRNRNQHFKKNINVVKGTNTP